MKYRKHVALTMALAAVGSVVLAGCSPAGEQSGESGEVTLRYAMWDSGQQPAYEACAKDFTEKTGIGVKVEQADWGAYWTAISTDLVAGTGADVFVNLTSNYPDYAQQGQLLDLTPFIEKDSVDLDAFEPVTVQNWQMDDKYWGLPKDIDAIGLVYDTAAVSAAGVDPATLGELEWNPRDGGTYGELIRRLSVDSAGRNGLDPAFDKSSVTRYGLAAPNILDIAGQLDWGNLVLGSGGELLDPNPFGTDWKFNSPTVVDAVQWYQDMIRDGYVQTPSLNSSLGSAALLDAGQIAMATDGSWAAGGYASGTAKLAWASFPAGTEGVKVYSNSLADTVNAGTKNPDQAWQWVKYLASAECQDTVASFGVVIPAIPESVASAEKAYAENGIDLKPIFETIANEDSTAALPVTLKYKEVEQLGQAAFQDIFLNGAEVKSTLDRLTEEATALYR